MASQNKKNKAKNSYIMGGAEAQKNTKCKRIWYFTKADRAANKVSKRDYYEIDY